MGMFDSVYLNCPRCDEPLEFQSKAGPCFLNNYSADAVPVDVAHDILHEDAFCPKCGVAWVPIITAPPVPETVRMDLVRKR